MPVLLVDPESGGIQSRYARSPYLSVLTNASEAEALPAVVRNAADQVLLNRSPEWLWAGGAGLKEGAAALFWMQGETPWGGHPASIRALAHQANRQILLPIHFPYMDEADLVAVEPRLLTGAHPAEAIISEQVRIRAAAGTGARIREALLNQDAIWAPLSLALRAEAEMPGTGMEAIQRLAQQRPISAVFHALAVRNLIVGLMRHGRMEEAARTLEQGLCAYPDYRDLEWLAALLDHVQGRHARAVSRLTGLVGASPGSWIGGGGERSYRAHWLLARIMEMAGEQRASFTSRLAAVSNCSDFNPAVEDLLKMRLPQAVVAGARGPLLGLCRRQPRFLPTAVDFLCLHGADGFAARLVETTADEAAAPALQARIDCAAGVGGAVAPASRRPGVIVHGPFLVYSSLARINRALGAALLREPRFQTGLDPLGFGQEALRRFPEGALLAPALAALPRQPQLTIRHRFPHDFSRPQTGALAVIFPWELSAIPRRWAELMRTNVDEVWVPSAFVREVLLRAGLTPERVRVVPNGVEQRFYRPEGERLRPQGCREFVFLFVGGPIQRKGFDLLLRAYTHAFRAADPVSLVVKPVGAQDCYRHLSLLPQAEAAAARPGTPPIIIWKDDLNDDQLSAMYRGADCLVLPYRGEGFGMPLAEAMACGRPVIATAAGPAPEFCPPEAGWLIPAAAVSLPEALRPYEEQTGPCTWFEPDEEALAAAMRAAFEDRAGTAARGRAAAAHVHATLGWDRVTSIYLERVAALTGVSAEAASGRRTAGGA